MHRHTHRITPQSLCVYCSLCGGDTPFVISPGWQGPLGNRHTSPPLSLPSALLELAGPGVTQTPSLALLVELKWKLRRQATLSPLCPPLVLLLCPCIVTWSGFEKEHCRRILDSQLFLASLPRPKSCHVFFSFSLQFLNFFCSSF